MTRTDTTIGAKFSAGSAGVQEAADRAQALALSLTWRSPILLGLVVAVLYVLYSRFRVLK